MKGSRGIVLVAAGLAAAAIGALPAFAAGDSTATPAAAGDGAATQAFKLPPPPPRRAHIRLEVAGIDNGLVTVGRHAQLHGRLRPFVAGEHVQVKLVRSGHVLKNVNPKVRRIGHKHVGRFHLDSGELLKPGHYRFVAFHHGNSQQRRAIERSKKFKIDYPDVDPGNSNGTVRTFNEVLADQGYYPSHGRRYGTDTSLAVMAFRKVNGMARNFNASPSIFRKLAAGDGEFHLKYPGAGRHVEVDISRQVMVLADNHKAQYTFPVSTGAPATPTIRGKYQFYSRQPGYNSVGMYYSVYWHGGYAIHGYHSVPPYPASHGCIRNPIPESKFIYNWVNIGESIYVYG